MGGIGGLLMAPFLFFPSISQSTTSLMMGAVALFLFSTAYGFMSFIIISGLKGDGHNVGQSYMSGFGAHPPGSIILSDEEIKTLKDKNIKRVEILSY